MIVKFIKKLILFISIIVCIFAVTGYVAVMVIPVKFDKMYQYAINAKYDHMVKISSPKIIVVGGSATAFGINEALLADIIHRPVANLGLHAVLGPKFVTNMAMANAGKDDIIVLAYEYIMWTGTIRTDPALATSAMDGAIGLYRFIPMDSGEGVAKYMPIFILKKIDTFLVEQPSLSPIGLYSSSSFNDDGKMVFERGGTVLPSPLPDVPPYSRIYPTANDISMDFINYVNDLYDYASKKGAYVVVSFPSTLDEALGVSVDELVGLENRLRSVLRAPIISNTKDYVYSREYMYDTTYHCNNAGEEVNTKKLAKDLEIFINSNK